MLRLIPKKPSPALAIGAGPGLSMGACRSCENKRKQIQYFQTELTAEKKKVADLTQKNTQLRLRLSLHIEGSGADKGEGGKKRKYDDDPPSPTLVVSPNYSRR